MKMIHSQGVLNRFNIEYFRNVSTFGALSDETLTWLLDEGALFELEKDEALFKPSEPGDTFFVILEGEFSYYKWHKNKYAYIRNYVLGQQIGFMSMIALHPRVGKAVAIEKSLVVEVSSDLFYQLHEKTPLDFGLLMMNLAREMARTLCAVDNIIVDKTYE